MKLSMKWGSKRPKSKPSVHVAPNVRWDLFKIPDRRYGPPSHSIDEIRREAQVISSRELGQGVRAKPVLEETKRMLPSNPPKSGAKPKRGPK